MMTKSREYVLDIFYRQLKELAVDERVELAPERAAETTLESLRLDSLETLQLAMCLEDALNVEIKVTDLKKSQTILEVVDHVLLLK
jgi:acyl carrier protein